MTDTANRQEFDYAIKDEDIDRAKTLVGMDVAGGSREYFSEVRRDGIQVRKPVVAAVNGHAIRFGLTYAMNCDIRYVANDAKLAFAFVRRGAIAEMGAHAIVPRVAGFSVAAQLMPSGRTVSGSDAARLGIASACFAADEVLPAAVELCREIAATRPLCRLR